MQRLLDDADKLEINVRKGVLRAHSSLAYWLPCIYCIKWLFEDAWQFGDRTPVQVRWPGGQIAKPALFAGCVAVAGRAHAAQLKAVLLLLTV